MVKIILLLALTVTLASSAPVLDSKTNINAIEQHEEGLLVIVPTYKIDGDGNPTKREIEYELISIPNEVLKREIRQVIQGYNYDPPSTSTSSTFQVHGTKEGEEFEFVSHSSSVTGTKEGEEFEFISTNDDGDNLIFPQSDPFKPTKDGYKVPASVPLNSPAKPALPLIPDVTNKPGLPNIDIAQILGSIKSVAGGALNTGSQFANGAQDAIKTATQLGQSAAVGGAQAVRWVIDQKTAGLSTASDVVTGGFQYAGRLSTAVLKTLLQVPGIKARVLAEILNAGQPLATTIGDVIFDSANDLADVLEAKTEILRDALKIVTRLIQDTLALNGRIIASFGAGGLDSGASLFNAGVRIGSAFIETAGGVASAVGKGVEEIIQVAGESELPPPPALPALNLPNFPALNLAGLTKPTAAASPVKPASVATPASPAKTYSKK